MRFPWRMAVFLAAGAVCLLAAGVELTDDDDPSLLTVLIWAVVGFGAVTLAIVEAARLGQEAAAPEPPPRPYPAPPTAAPFAAPPPEPVDADAAFARGTELAAQDRVEEAIDWLRAAVDQGHPRAANNLGSMLHQAGDQEAARQLYLLGVVQGDPVAATNLARDLLDDGNVEEAAHYLEIAADGGDPDGALLLGQLLEARRDYRAAAACYREAASAHPSALVLAAGAYWKAQLPEEADEVLRAAAEHDDRQVAFEARAVLAVARAEEGNEAAAAIWFRRAQQVGTPEGVAELRRTMSSSA